MDIQVVQLDPEPTEVQIVEMLSHRYGDGHVYLPVGRSRRLLSLAIKLGYISEDGYVTRKGRELLAHYKSD